MSQRNNWVFVVPLMACVASLAACEPATVKATETKPAQVEAIAGSELHRVRLTPRAAERLDIKTAEVRQAQGHKVVPYGAVLYDAKGQTWVYTSPEPLVFVRHQITIDYIEGDLAVLSDGPAIGTKVVTVGGAELFGAEFEIGH